MKLSTMKFLSLAIAFLLLWSMTNVYAQTPSIYDANGKVKSVETRRYEESRNKQNNYTPEKISVPVPASTAPSRTNSTGKIYYDAATAEAEKLRKIKEAAAKEAFIKKVAKYDEADVAAYRSEGNYIRVKSAGKYGLVDITGEVVIPLVYDELSKNYMGGGFKARIGNKWGFIDKDKATVPIKYDELNDFDHVYDYTTKSMKFMSFAKLDGKYGYVGTTGEAIIPVIYDELEVNPCCGIDLYAAKLNGKWGFLDNNGIVKIPFQFDSLVKKFTFPNNKTSENSENGYFKKTSAKATVIKDNASFEINIGGIVDGPKTDIVTGKTILELLKTGSFVDTRNNRSYQTIQIGTQVWMAENLDIGQFRNGDKIPEADDEKEWNKADKKNKAAWCYYDNDPVNSKFGRLYNFYAVNDPRGLAPAGWHIPTELEWRTLIAGLGGESVAFKSLMDTSWIISKNKCGFSALPVGYRNMDHGKATFFLSTYSAAWWSSNLKTEKYVYYYVITTRDMREGFSDEMGNGLSVRCIKDVN
jgi:uncharacterized protein (TIGR02145 family)